MHNVFKNGTMSEELRKEINSDAICDNCNIEMKETIKPRSKYGKENTYYNCEICGNHHRKRRLNEIARDMGLRE